MKKKILFIDVDDTILDFTGGEKIAIRQTLSLFGLPTDSKTIAIYHECNNIMWQAFERGEVTKPELVDKRFEMFFERIGITGINPHTFNNAYFENLKEQHAYRKGAQEFIEKISKYYRIILVTNGTTIVQDSRLNASGLINKVEAVFISEQLGTKKPEKQYFDIVASNIDGFSKQNCVIVGDSLTSDVLGGKNIGIKTIWYNPLGTQATDIVPDIVVYDYDMLYKCLVDLL